MNYRPARTIFGLIAVGGAVAVGVITRDVGFTALTFFGGLMLPRILGVRTHRGWGGWGHGSVGRDEMRNRFGQRFESWHRQAHGEEPAPPPAGGTVSA